MTTNNHPAHGPVSLDRLHQIREILSKAAAQSDGGNLGYAMADAVKVFNGVLESMAREQVRREYAVWSQATFGDVGPVGPLKHLSKERLEEIAELARKATYKPCAMHMTNLLAVCDSEVIEEMARQLLASMEQEPVAWKYRLVELATEGAGPWKMCLAPMEPGRWAAYRTEVIPLYAAPQLPQPAVLSVSEGVLKSLLPDVEKSEFWFEHNGKIFFEGVRFNNAVFEACRAAMLQGKSDGTLTNEGTIPATQFKPVADLYGITSPTGSETSFTFDAVEARDFIDGGWTCQEYVELERFQDAMTNHSGDANEKVNSPVTPDGYVLVPKKLTAENGAKRVLSGEFSETKFINCPECFGDDDCETCDGSGRIEITVPVTWTTIKAIWAKGVEHFTAAPQQENV
ncbi:TPA: dATP/dGTP pyrophosphohydrolase domain-containing protein [Citrobacter freundii]